jgi:membrane protease YdiL (CAAX protease family)
VTQRAILLLPFIVLAITRLAIEGFVRVFPLHVSWVPSMLVYYAAIEGAAWYVRRAHPSATLSFARKPLPRTSSLIVGALLPAMLPLGFFVLNVRAVPVWVLIAILLFAAVNPYFEELFWRGLMSLAPASRAFRILYSGLLFAFAHWFLLGSYWFKDLRVLISVVITTFLMGMAWMWFYLRERTLFYPLVSHILVDIFNLSVAMFLGLRLVTV